MVSVAVNIKDNVKSLNYMTYITYQEALPRQRKKLNPKLTYINTMKY